MYKVLIRIPLLRNIVKYYDKHRSPVYFISFPKCGRTWVRMMLAKLLHKKYVDYDTPLLNIVEPKFRRPGFPGIKWVHDDSAHWKKPDELNKSKLNYKYKKVIFMVRDPMDVVVSLFFEKYRRLSAYADGESKQYPEVRERVKPFEGDLSFYLRQPVGSFETILRYYKIWDEQKDNLDHFLLVRYEDIMENPKNELWRIVNFIDFQNVDDREIEEAVSFSEFSKMHKMKKEGRFNSYSLRPSDINDPESFKTRKGKIGGYMDYLSEKEISLLTTRMNQELAGIFGYGQKK